MISFQKVIDINPVASTYLAKRKNAPNKLCYALNRILPRIKKIAAKFNEDLEQEFEDIMNKWCLTEPPNDPKGRILRNAQGQLEFIKEDLDKACKEQRIYRAKARAEVNIEFEPYYATAIPEDITEEELDAFEGIVIHPDEVARIRAKQEGLEEVSKIAPVNGQAVIIQDQEA